MEWWIYRQLRSRVMNDLREFIPDVHFEAGESFKVHESIPNADDISAEIHWGRQAAIIGRKLFFDTSLLMTPRQRSASDVLMNLGMLVGAEATQRSAKSASEYAAKLGVSDGNSGNVATQMEKEQIPTLSNNVQEALKLYVNYLPKREASIYLNLLGKNRSKWRKMLLHLKVGISWLFNNIVARVITGVLVAIIVFWFGIGGT